jgi:hypothetical protein
MALKIDPLIAAMSLLLAAPWLVVCVRAKRQTGQPNVRRPRESNGPQATVRLTPDTTYDLEVRGVRLQVDLEVRGVGLQADLTIWKYVASAFRRT